MGVLCVRMLKGVQQGETVRWGTTATIEFTFIEVL
jgi:hypothetical protein